MENYMLKKITNFSLDKNQDSQKNCLYLKNFIDNLVEQDLKLVFEKQSNILDLPSKITNKKLKISIFNKFDFESGKFRLNNKFFNILRGYLINIFLIFYVLIFRKKKEKFEERDIILEEVNNIEELYRFKSLLSKFEKSFFIKKNNFQTFKKIIPNSKPISFIFKAINQEFLHKKIFSLIKFTNFLFVLSLKKKFNYIYFSNIILFSTLKSESIFYNYRSKFKINDRFYYTCPIKNYIFKKYNGKLNVCTQIHLPESSISFYTDADILFTLGNEKFSKEKLLDLGGDITDIFPVGSLKMESLLLNNKKIINSENYKSDILIIGINIHRWIHTSNLIKKNYYNFIEWIKKISENFPNLKIVYKHHTNNKKDIYEEKLLKNSNIKIIKGESNILLDHHAGSYYYLNNSKIVFSFGSSMILEARGLNKNAYFIDPKFENSSFFHKLEHLKDIRINNFDNLESIIKKQVINDEKSNDIFCIPSNNTSEKIFNFLNNFNL